MYKANRTTNPSVDRVVADRRSGIKRRVVTYDGCIPERRGMADRRQAGILTGASHATWRIRHRTA
ncbi:MAG: hypothetical protein PVG51_04510 [Desulfosarcina sp.]|jgi:hypothetical protein